MPQLHLGDQNHMMAPLIKPYQKGEEAEGKYITFCQLYLKESYYYIFFYPSSSALIFLWAGGGGGTKKNIIII